MSVGKIVFDQTTWSRTLTTERLVLECVNRLFKTLADIFMSSTWLIKVLNYFESQPS